MSQRVRRAARGSAVVLSATATAKQHLQEFIGVDSIQHLETGLDCQVSSPRTARDATEPLRVLWAGRLRPWKCFPLLAKAVAELPDARRVQVRVLGTGPCKSPWIRLTERLGIADRFDWIEWPAYQDTLQHYAWADVFAFTSLRDTSGTGLLESLAAGAPVLGVDHQGAADIMTEHCAIPLPVSSPGETIRHLAQAMVELDDDRNRLLRLSHGAQQRAADFEWHRRIAWTSEVYRSALQQSAREAKALPSLATLKQQTDLDSPVPVGVSTGSAASATY